ncbi:MAG: metallophosphoesterase [Candidatus Aureabacteria bacterium]|nr:metallophosphoesterase [Candidatus Auribacterota bacterium]
MMRKLLLVLSLVVAWGLVVAGTAFLDAFLLEPNWLSVTRVTVVHPLLGPALNNLTIVQISDLHARTGNEFMMRSVEREIARLNPDVIFITGDMVSRRLALRAFRDFARRLRPGIWIYAIPGDDDDALINDSWRDEEWRASGTALLVNEIVPVVWPRTGGRRLWLVASGPDFDWAGARAKIPEGEPVIVIAHKPFMVKGAVLGGADFVLAGDTHGGQVGLTALSRLSTYGRRGPYIAGLYRVKNTLLYVNRGIGWKARPMRFFCRPELTVFRFAAAGVMAQPKVLPGDE